MPGPPTPDQSVYHARAQVWTPSPLSRTLDDKNTPFSTEITDFDAQ